MTALQRQSSDDLSSFPDEVLMAQVATGDSHALEQLYQRYARIVYGMALRMLGNAEHAEDVVQEAFWRVWRRSNTFREGHGQFTSWLFGIAHNLCIDEIRRQRSRPTPAHRESLEILHTITDVQQDVDVLAWQSEQRRLIVDALRELPPDQREVIELAYFGGFSQREIADQLNDPLGTVKTRIRLGLQKLKQCLYKQGISHEEH